MLTKLSLLAAGLVVQAVEGCVPQPLVDLLDVLGPVLGVL